MNTLYTSIQGPQPTPAPGEAPQAQASRQAARPAVAATAWTGHHPLTRSALERIERDVRRGGSIGSVRERVLVTACELRRATAQGEWVTAVLGNADGMLASARFALNEIGAMRVAAQVSQARSALRHMRSRQRREAAVRALEARINASGAFLDALIARYASGLIEPPRPSRRGADQVSGVGGTLPESWLGPGGSGLRAPSVRG